MIRVPGRRELLGIGGLTVIAAVLCVCAHFMSRFPGDLRLALLVQSIDCAGMDTVMEWVSRLTGGWRVPVLVIAGSVAAWRWLGRLEALPVLLTGLSSPIQSGLKLLVDRPRPAPDLVHVFQAEAGNSFPSGHAFFAMAFWGLLAYFAYTRLQKRGLRWLTISGLVMIILLIGTSRVYLGAHWPSDVMGGYVMGGTLLAVLVWLDRGWKRHPEPASPEGNSRGTSPRHPRPAPPGPDRTAL